MISQWYDPEQGSAIMPGTIARALQERGNEVQVVTGFPNYPGGRVYPGYRIRPWQREVIDGVSVTRVALYPSHDSSGVRRALNYLSFAGSASLAVPWRRRPDVVYVDHPPATVALPAMVLRTLRGVPFVYDVQDLWPDTLSATGMVDGSRALELVGTVMARVYRRAAEVVVLSEGFRRRLVARGVAEEKVSVIHNWNAEDQISMPSEGGGLRHELGLGEFDRQGQAALLSTRAVNPQIHAIQRKGRVVAMRPDQCLTAIQFVAQACRELIKEGLVERGAVIGVGGDGAEILQCERLVVARDLAVDGRC